MCFGFSFCTLGTSLALHLWRFPTHAPQPKIILKATFVFTLITYYTCKGYVRRVKICEIPSQMMLQMLKICLISWGTFMEEKLKEIPLDSGSAGAENSCWLRDYWWEVMPSPGIGSWLVLRTWHCARRILGLTQHTSLSLLLPCPTQQNLLFLFVMAINLIIYESSKRSGPLPSVVLSLLTSHPCFSQLNGLSLNQAQSLVVARLQGGFRGQDLGGLIAKGHVLGALRGREAKHPIIQVLPSCVSLLIFHLGNSCWRNSSLVRAKK